MASLRITKKKWITRMSLAKITIPSKHIDRERYIAILIKILMYAPVETVLSESLWPAKENQKDNYAGALIYVIMHLCQTQVGKQYPLKIRINPLSSRLGQSSSCQGNWGQFGFSTGWFD